MENSNESISIIRFREEMLKMCQAGRNSEAITLTQSKIDEISKRKVISKSARKKSNKLKNLLLELGSNITSENDAGNSNSVVPYQPTFQHSGYNLQVHDNISYFMRKIPTSIPTAVLPMSKFLLYLKRALDLVEIIGKAAVVDIIDQTIHNVKMNKGDNYQREISCHKKIKDILMKEDSRIVPLRNKPNELARYTRKTQKNKPKSPSNSEQNVSKKNKRKKKKKTQQQQNSQAEISSCKPKIKAEPSSNTNIPMKNIVKIENTANWSTKVHVKQEKVEID